MKKWVHGSEEILAMSNVRGRFIVVEDVPFSFYYSVMNGNHGPRVKVTMNSDNLRPNRMSSLKLCDDWELIQNEQDSRISAKDLNEMKQFFRKYLVMFLLVWEDYISEPALGDYFEGKISFSDFVSGLDFYGDWVEEMDEIHDVAELEKFCRKYNLVNMYGN